MASVPADGLASVAKIARREVGAGRVISAEFDRSDRIFEAVVLTDDLVEHAVRLNLADGEPLAPPEAERVDGDDEDEARARIAAKVEFATAVRKASSVQAGAIVGLSLDEHLGAVVWDADVIAADGVPYRGRIDAEHRPVDLQSRRHRRLTP